MGSSRRGEEKGLPVPPPPPPNPGGVTSRRQKEAAMEIEAVGADGNPMLALINAYLQAYKFQTSYDCSSDTIVMAFCKPCLVFYSVLTFLILNGGPSHVLAKVFMVVMEDDPIISPKSSQKKVMRGEEAQKYKAMTTTKHDIFLDSFLPAGSYKKLYSYTHLLNGFAIYVKSEKAIKTLSGAKGVRLIQEDIKMAKMTTYTPRYIGANVVWPLLGGAEKAGDRVVIGMVDTGIDPSNPSFLSTSDQAKPPPASFKGTCQTGERFPPDSCNGKIVGARWFARAGQATGEFNATMHYASPYDPDGHGSLAIYKAAYSFGGYMSDVIAAVDKAVEDGVDIISLSLGPTTITSGPASFLNLLETQLLLATKAGISVVQAVGNGGPDANSVVSFSPWITSVGASTTDRKYNKSIIIGNGQVFSCGGLSPSTPGETMYPLALADDVSNTNSTGGSSNCQDPDVFIRSLVQGKVIICMFVSSNYYEGDFLAGIVDTIQKIGAAGVIITDRSSSDSDIEYHPTFPTSIPSAIVVNSADAQALLEYYDDNLVRDKEGSVTKFGATIRILDGRRAIYTREAPVVAEYSSRGPDVDDMQMQAADVLKPNVMAPGHHIWGAWSPTSDAMVEFQGESYAMLSGTSMATPHFLCAVPGVDDAAVLRAVGVPCPPSRARWCSDLNAPSVTVASLVGSRRVDRRVTSVGAENETYMAHVQAPDGVAVRVSPDTFAVAPGATATLRIVLNTTAPGNTFSFGEVVLRGDKKHTVRIPLAVFPAAALSP
uniref:Subtilisin-like protease n=1 Tax=Oryza barthii TaxID=65489 RepID=A0A0D3FYJ3_9ORYZ